MPSSLHDDSEARTLTPSNGEEDSHQSVTNETEAKMEGNGIDSSSTAAPLTTDIESQPENDSKIPASEFSDKSTKADREEQKEVENPDAAKRTSLNDKDVACELSSVVITSLDQLPPLPIPRDDMLRVETPRGICVVTTCIVLCIFLTHYIALTLVLPSKDLDDDNNDSFGGNSYDVGKIIFLVLVYTESVAALLCTIGILYADPGVVHRSLETCNPLPKAVESWVVSEPTAPRPKDLDSYLRGADKRLYCTKCLVWRKPGVPNYHCPICQRCCANHDHHCNVFGRCIAGNPKFWKPKSNRGNLMYFYGILTSGGWAFLTVFSAFLYASSVRYRPEYAIPICIGIVLLISCCCVGTGPISVVCWPCHRICRKATSLIKRKKWPLPPHHQVSD